MHTNIEVLYWSRARHSIDENKSDTAVLSRDANPGFFPKPGKNRFPDEPRPQITIRQFRYLITSNLLLWLFII